MQWYLFSSNILFANIDDNFLGILALPDFSVGSSLRLYHKSDSIFTVPLLGKRSSNASSLTFSDIASFRCVLDALMHFILFYFYHFFNLIVCCPLKLFSTGHFFDPNHSTVPCNVWCCDCMFHQNLEQLSKR